MNSSQNEPMASVQDLQRIVDRVQNGNMCTDELRVLLHHKSPLIRANALEALVCPAQQDIGLLEDLVAAASDPMNRVTLMGTISVAHVAVACLFRIGRAEAVNAARTLLNDWRKADRADLDWYLKSEGLNVS